MRYHLFCICLLTLICFNITTESFADSLTPFTSDGCSSFPDGTFEENELWLACCVEHDRAYWRGGTYNERLKADVRLRDCVQETGQPFIAEVMKDGVRVGGSPFFPTSYRWGYGWSYLRGYKKLNSQEKLEADRLMQEYESRENSGE